MIKDLIKKRKKNCDKEGKSMRNTVTILNNMV